MASAINTSEPALLNLTGALFNISEGLILEYDLTLSNTSGNGSEVGANDYEFVYTMKDSERQILGLITGAMGMVRLVEKSFYLVRSLSCRAIFYSKTLRRGILFRQFNMDKKKKKKKKKIPRRIVLESDFINITCSYRLDRLSRPQVIGA